MNTPAAFLTTTERNWCALKKLAYLYLLEQNRIYPSCTLEDLFARTDIPNTALFNELVAKAGFRSRNDPSTSEMLAVAQYCMTGVKSADVIARETGIRLERVTQILGLFSEGYGKAPYGIAPYGGNRKVSNGKSAVPRRVTRTGQMSYRGHTYTLGCAYRGRTAMLVELGTRLVATFSDRPPLDLACRHYK